MYPRTDEEKARGRHCGFVSFENRRMAEAAKNALDGKDIMGMVVRIGWGKAVSKPIVAPTPMSMGVGIVGAIPTSRGFTDKPPEKAQEKVEKKKIIVTVPTNRRIKAVIDVMAKFVSEEGHLFEEQIKEKEANNETYAFLRDIGSPENNYYRWLVFAYGQGDSTKSWRTEPFQITFGGDDWVPPGPEYWQSGKQKISNFSDEPTGPTRDKNTAVSGGTRLSDRAREDLEDMLRDINRDRKHICDVMVWCLDHSDSAIEIAECLYESLTIAETEYDLKISRLYLLSDILHNSSCARPSAWAFRAAFERRLPLVFQHLNEMYRNISGRLTADKAKGTLMKVLRVWEGWGVYSPQFSKGLECSFLCDPGRIVEICKSAVKPWRTMKDCSEAQVEDAPMDDLSENATTDGELLPYFDDMAQYPVWLRSSINSWMRKEIPQLEREIRQKGLCVPQRCHATEGLPIYKFKLVQVLAGYELYCKEKKCEEAKNISTFLTQDAITAASDTPAEEPLFMPDSFAIGTDMEPTMGEMSADEAQSAPEPVQSSITSVRNRDDSASESSEDLFQDEKPENEGPLLSDAEEDSDRDNDIFADANDTAGPLTNQNASPRAKETPQDKLKRAKLRQVELEVTKLQDSLEKQGVSDKDLINLQCDQKRQELLAKVERELIRELSDDQKNTRMGDGESRVRSLSPSEKRRSVKKRGRVK
eukprot:Selendium_serpulae@DN6375_c0_g1_i17.p1